jgi:GxxExxY protein
MLSLAFFATSSTLRLNFLVRKRHDKPEDKAMAKIDSSREVIAAALAIHRKLGPGLLESAYEACLACELEKAGFRVERQKAVPLVYESVKLDCGFRADLVVEGKIVVELKCKEALHPVDEAQLLSYLRLLNIPIGLLINFHVALLKDGIKRMVNNYREEDL